MIRKAYIAPSVRTVALPVGRQLLAGSDNEEYKVNSYTDGGEETVGGD
jgi:hypothetical protein